MTASDRLASVLEIREHQRTWLESTRRRAAEGEPFVVCTSDEVEEILTALGIPVLVINYWNFVITAGRRGAHFTEVLHRHGYPGPHFFGLGYAASLEPEQAPWGGLPRPALIIGSTRNESELRVTELWARELGCACHPMDFNFASIEKLVPPDDWWRTVRDRWEDMVDPARLQLRVEQNRELAEVLESQLGRSLDDGALGDAMALVNQQMDIMDEAAELIARAPSCPVTLRDQVSAYQSTWHRGSPVGVQLARRYRDEVQARVEQGTAAYPRERHRLLLWSMSGEPRFHAFMQEQHGAVLVGSPYAAMPATYARTVHGDPLRALAARQLFLFDMRSTSWMLEQARRHRVDAVIAVEPPAACPSRLATAAESAGLPFLSVPDGNDDAGNRERLDRFLATL